MRKRVTMGVVVLLALLGGAYLAVSYVLYDQLTDVAGSCDRHAANRPNDFVDRAGWWGTDFDYEAYFMPQYEEVRFPSRQDGLTIAAFYVEAAADASTVILVHGLGGCKNAHEVLVPGGILWRHGFNVLLLDVRDVGESDMEDGRSAIGNEEYLDVLGAWDWLATVKGIPAERIGLLGNSLGAATALNAFRLEPRVAAVFVDSPFDNLPQIIEEELARNNYPLFLTQGGIWMARLVAGDNLLAYDPGDAVNASNGRPMYIIHGTADTRIDYHHSLQLRDRAAALGADNVTVQIVAGVNHIQMARDYPQEYETAVVNFFRTALK